MACPPGTPTINVDDSLHYVTGAGQFIRTLYTSPSPAGTDVTTDNQVIVSRVLDSTDPWYPTITLQCFGVVGTGINSVDHVEWAIDYGTGITGYQSVFPGFTGQIKAATAIEGNTITVYMRTIGGASPGDPYNTSVTIVERADFEYWVFDNADPTAADVGTDSVIKVLSIGAGGTPPANWYLRSFDDSAWDDPLGSVRPHDTPYTGRIWPPSHVLGGLLTLISVVGEIALGRHTFRLGSDTPGVPPPPPPNPTSVDSVALTVNATKTLLAAYLDDVALTIPTPTAVDYERNQYVFTIAPSAINLSNPVHVLAVEVEANPSGVILASNFTGETKAHGGMDWFLEIVSCAGGARHVWGFELLG